MDHKKLASEARKSAVNADSLGERAFADKQRALALKHEKLAGMTEFGRLLAESVAK